MLVEEFIQNLFARAKAEYGNIHMLCSNAAWALIRSQGDLGGGKKRLGLQWALTIKACCTAFNLFIPHMVEHGESHLMTTVSLAGLLPGSGTYGVSKHAVMAIFTEAARNDLPGYAVRTYLYRPYVLVSSIRISTSPSATALVI